MAMAEMAYACDVTTIVATPHANQMGRFENFYTPDFAVRYRRLERLIQSYGINIDILEGQEIMA
ncbi:MAG: hypothetical protein IKD59_06840, partial [Lachnospiraceae bacterium]|nr:hypothetical protein [Lachnospiraceae bacterium]